MRYGKLAFGFRASTASTEEYASTAKGMLEASGILELEQKVLGFLYSHGGSLKLLSILDDAIRLLHQVGRPCTSFNLVSMYRVSNCQSASPLSRNFDTRHFQERLTQGTHLCSMVCSLGYKCAVA